MPDWPEWWEWELEIIDHAEERMRVRHFTLAWLRDMPDGATGYRAGRVPGRSLIETRHDGSAWVVVVEHKLASLDPVA
jgi:hypothetical protein